MKAFPPAAGPAVPATALLWPQVRHPYAGMPPATRGRYRSILFATIRRRSVGYSLGALLVASGAIE